MRFPPGCLRHVALLLCVSCLVDLCVEPASVCSGGGRRPVGRCRRRLGGLPGGLSFQLISGVPPLPWLPALEHWLPWEHAQHVNVHLSAFLLSCVFSCLIHYLDYAFIVRCSMHIHRQHSSDSAEESSQSSDSQHIHRSAVIGFD